MCVITSSSELQHYCRFQHVFVHSGSPSLPPQPHASSLIFSLTCRSRVRSRLRCSSLHTAHTVGHPGIRVFDVCLTSDLSALSHRCCGSACCASRAFCLNGWCGRVPVAAIGRLDRHVQKPVNRRAHILLLPVESEVDVVRQSHLSLAAGKAGEIGSTHPDRISSDGLSGADRNGVT